MGKEGERIGWGGGGERVKEGGEGKSGELGERGRRAGVRGDWAEGRRVGETRKRKKRGRRIV